MRQVSWGLVVTRADDSVSRQFAGCGTSLPEQDAMAIDPGNPWRCLGYAFGLRILRSIKWKKAMEAIPFGTGFAHHTPGVLGKTGGLRPGL